MSDNDKKPMGPLEMIAALDQAAAMSVDLAKLLASYMKSLRAAGFTEKAALELVIEYQRIILTPRPGPA